MVSIIRLHLISFVCLVVGFLLFLPFVQVHASFVAFPKVENNFLYQVASVSNTTAKLTYHNTFPKVEKDSLYQFTSVSNTTEKLSYHDVLLSDLNSTVTGELSKAKISVPSSVTAGDYGSAVVSEIGGYLEVYVYTKDELWLDTKNNFVAYDDTTGKAVRIESVNKTNGVTKSKKGVFQGSKSNPTLVRIGTATNISVSGESAPGSVIEIYNILIYDKSLQNTVSIALIAPKESSKTNQKVWNTLLKTLQGAKNKNVLDSKSTNSVKSSTAYKGKYFSITFPKGWSSVGEENDAVGYIAPNLGSTMGVARIQLDTSFDYDPDLRSFWLSSFLEEYENQMQDFEFLSSSDVTMDGLPGLRIDFKTTISGVPMEGYQLVTVKSGIEYVLTAFVTDKNQWSKYRDVIAKSFATFKRTK